jgi:hypothetical protein
MITRRELHQLFDLNDKGELIWKKLPVHLNKLKGTAAGTPDSFGRIRIHINRRFYARAHLVYQYVYGGPLPSWVSHKNGNITDDRPENLRCYFDFRGRRLNQENLRRAFELNYETGELFRKVAELGEVVLEDEPSGCLDDDGRWVLDVWGQLVHRNRLVYLYVYGKMPKQIEHINGELADDRPENLRPITVSQKHHRRTRARRYDLPKGVWKRAGKLRERPFYADIKRGGERFRFGPFETVKEASDARDAKAVELYREYAKLNNYQPSSF